MIGALPDDIVSLLFSRLSVRDTAMVSAVSRNFRRVASLLLSSVRFGKVVAYHTNRTWMLASEGRLDGTLTISSELIVVRNDAHIHFLAPRIVVDNLIEMAASKNFHGLCVEFQGRQYWRVEELCRGFRIAIRVAGKMIVGEDARLMMLRMANQQNRLCCFEALNWVVQCQVSRKFFDVD